MSEFNDWFCSLPEGRQTVLRDDKWRLADSAFQAGFKQAQAEIDALKAQNAELLAALQAVVDNADYIDTGHEIAIDALERIKARGDL